MWRFLAFKNILTVYKMKRGECNYCHKSFVRVDRHKCKRKQTLIEELQKELIEKTEIISELQDEIKSLRSAVRNAENQPSLLKLIKKLVVKKRKKIPTVNTIIVEKCSMTDRGSRKNIPKAVRIALWEEHFTDDNAKGVCKVCNCEIKISNFEAGHIVSWAKGGSDTLNNLLPVCSLCNKSMGTENLLEFKEKYFANLYEDEYNCYNIE